MQSQYAAETAHADSKAARLLEEEVNKVMRECVEQANQAKDEVCADPVM
jgi:hypothetical protein